MSFTLSPEQSFEAMAAIAASSGETIKAPTVSSEFTFTDPMSKSLRERTHLVHRPLIDTGSSLNKVILHLKRNMLGITIAMTTTAATLVAGYQIGVENNFIDDSDHRAVRNALSTGSLPISDIQVVNNSDIQINEGLSERRHPNMSEYSKAGIKHQPGEVFQAVRFNEKFWGFIDQRNMVVFFPSQYVRPTQSAK